MWARVGKAISFLRGPHSLAINDNLRLVGKAWAQALNKTDSDVHFQRVLKELLENLIFVLVDLQTRCSRVTLNHTSVFIQCSMQTPMLDDRLYQTQLVAQQLRLQFFVKGEDGGRNFWSK